VCHECWNRCLSLIRLDRVDTITSELTVQTVGYFVAKTKVGLSHSDDEETTQNWCSILVPIRWRLCQMSPFIQFMSQSCEWAFLKHRTATGRCDFKAVGTGFQCTFVKKSRFRRFCWNNERDQFRISAQRLIIPLG
jgi:hypothetical protein